MPKGGEQFKQYEMDTPVAESPLPIVPSPSGATIENGDFTSPNYKKSISGWKLSSDGDIEANDGNFKGDITGASGAFSGILSATSGGNTVTLAPGSTTAIAAGPTGAPTFTVTQAGVMTATGAVIDGYVLSSKGVFGGDGSDGALAITSGTTTIDLGGAAVVTKQYSSISITSTGKLAFSNPAAAGTTIIIKCKGACTLTSSTNPLIELRGLGGAGGTGGTTTPVDGSENTDYGVNILSTGKYGIKGTTGASVNAGGGGASAVTVGTAGAGGGGGATGTIISSVPLFLLKGINYTGYKLALAGAGGGGGCRTDNAAFNSYGTDGAGGSLATPNGTAGGAINGSDGNTSFNGGSGGGGAGGGALIVEVNGALNFTGTINAGGGTGGVGGASTGAAGIHNGGAGGGGGAGGTIIVLYNTLTANSGTTTITGGTGGSGGAGASATGSAGGNGGDGFSLVAQNINLA